MQELRYDNNHHRKLSINPPSGGSSLTRVKKLLKGYVNTKRTLIGKVLSRQKA